MSYKSFVNGLGAIVIVICIAGLIWSVSQYNEVFGVGHKKEQVKVQLVVKVDTIGHMDSMTSAQVDSLIAKIETHEHLLQDKYEHIIEQKEIFNDVLTIGGMMLAVVLSLFGFFGYKSLNTIEERAEVQAKQASEGFFKDQFENYKKETKSELEESLIVKVKEKVEKDLSVYKNIIKNEIEEKVKAASSKYGNDVAELKTSNENFEMSLENLDERLSKLAERVVKLEDTLPLQEGRRTLAFAGRKVNPNAEKSTSNTEEGK